MILAAVTVLAIAVYSLKAVIPLITVALDALVKEA